MQKIGDVPNKGFRAFNTCLHQGRVFHLSVTHCRLVVTEVLLSDRVEFVRVETGINCKAYNDLRIACCSMGSQILMMTGRGGSGEGHESGEGSGTDEVFAGLLRVEGTRLHRKGISVTPLIVSGAPAWLTTPYLCRLSQQRAILHLYRRTELWACELGNGTLTLAPLPSAAPNYGFQSVPVRIRGKRLLVAGSGEGSRDITIISPGGDPEIARAGKIPGVERRLTSLTVVVERFVIGFGGQGSAQGGHDGYLNDLWVFDLQTYEAAALRQEGYWALPDQTVFLAVLGGTLYFIGGWHAAVHAIPLRALPDLVQNEAVSTALREELGQRPPQQTMPRAVAWETYSLSYQALNAAPRPSRNAAPASAAPSTSSAPERASKDAQIAQLKASLARAEQGWQDERARCSTLSTELLQAQWQVKEAAGLRQELEGAKRRIQQLESDLQFANKNASDLKLSLDRSYAQFTSVINARDKALAEASLVSGLQTTVKSLREQVRRLQDEVTAATATNTSVQTSLGRVRESLEAEKRKSAMLTGELSTTRMTAESEAQEKDSLIAKQRSTLDQVQRQLAQSRKDLTVAKSDYASLSASLRTAWDKAACVPELEFKIRKLKKECQDLRDRLQKAQNPPGVLLVKFPLSSPPQPFPSPRWRLERRVLQMLKETEWAREKVSSATSLADKKREGALDLLLDPRLPFLALAAATTVSHRSAYTAKMRQIANSLLLGRLFPKGAALPAAKLCHIRLQEKFLDSSATPVAEFLVNQTLLGSNDFGASFSPLTGKITTFLRATDPLAREADHTALSSMRTVFHASRAFYGAVEAKGLAEAIMCLARGFKTIGPDFQKNNAENFPEMLSAAPGTPDEKTLKGWRKRATPKAVPGPKKAAKPAEHSGQPPRAGEERTGLFNQILSFLPFGKK